MQKKPKEPVWARQVALPSENLTWPIKNDPVVYLKGTLTLWPVALYHTEAPLCSLSNLLLACTRTGPSPTGSGSHNIKHAVHKRCSLTESAPVNRQHNSNFTDSVVYFEPFLSDITHQQLYCFYVMPITS